MTFETFVSIAVFLNLLASRDGRTMEVARVRITRTGSAETEKEVQENYVSF